MRLCVCVCVLCNDVIFACARSTIFEKCDRKTQKYEKLGRKKKIHDIQPQPRATEKTLLYYCLRVYMHVASPPLEIIKHMCAVERRPYVLQNNNTHV